MITLIGRILATEKSPTTIDEFNFWTNSDSNSVRLMSSRSSISTGLTLLG